MKLFDWFNLASFDYFLQLFYSTLSMCILPGPIFLLSSSRVRMNDIGVKILIPVFGDPCFWLCCSISF